MSWGEALNKLGRDGGLEVTIKIKKTVTNASRIDDAPVKRTETELGQAECKNEEGESGLQKNGLFEEVQENVVAEGTFPINAITQRVN